MHSILNRKVAFLLCFIINIIHFNVCLSEPEAKTLIANDDYYPIDSNKEIAKDSVESITPNSSQGNDEVNSENAKQLRAAAYGSYHNYRSSYVGSNSNRRLIGRPGLRSAAMQNSLIENPISLDKSALTKNKRKSTNELTEEIKYNVGPGVNISVEKAKELVSVNLDEDCLKDVFTGRGKNKDLITKILPLFILPFLIQSAVVPFLVSTLKLLLIKSIFVGKIAIFLLLLSAFKNHAKYAYDTGPQFYPDVPNRRSEAHLTGYRVEGKPTAWVN